MSRIDNVEALEKQLAELQTLSDNNTTRTKKVPPAVPPKKKPLPQIPQSSLVSGLREPSYSTKLPTNITSNQPNDIRPVYKDYMNMNHFDMPKTYQSKPYSLSANNNPTYSNIPSYKRQEENHQPPLPPPPPLPPAQNINRNHEEYLPPPSPVSSNYSELARATANINYNHEKLAFPHVYQNEYMDYGTSQSSTYEPLYEPINARPESNLSMHTNSSTNYHNNQQSFSKSPMLNKSPLPKEEEVDALTNLLVQSISDSQDLDVFGTCITCSEKVVGETSGCTAMGNMYHVKCFCCHHCNTNLQGKPFYAVEGQPYCEKDYFETLEKCSVCYEPILDRILRATGKPYHPTCFTCVVCGKSLDGIPFTVDAMNQIHCIEDFHKKFAPRCCVCEHPIMPEEGQEETVRVVALDRSFHVRCYRCEDCGLVLTTEAEGRGCYPLDDHILCKDCNIHRIRLLTNVMTTDL